MQWMQGRPTPILLDELDAVDLVKKLLAKGANPNAAAASATPFKRHHDAGTTLNFGEGATPLMRAAQDQRHGGDEGAARRAAPTRSPPCRIAPTR